MLARFVRILTVMITLCSSLLADSLIPNGGFETGTFAGWTAVGDALVVGSNFGNTPYNGSYQAMVTNAPAYLGYPTTLPPYANGTFSGTEAVEAFSGYGTGIVSPMDEFLGLPSNALRAFGNTLQIGDNFQYPTFEGSAMSITFSGSAGDVISFAWSYLTNEHPGTHFDFAFGVLDSSIFLLQASEDLVSVGATPYFFYSSAYQLFSITLQTTGVHTFSLGIVDSGLDQAIDSALLIDGFAVTTPLTATALPAPPSLLLLGIGLLILALINWRRI